MSRPATRPKNANQHPGHILLEGKQNRRTSEQKQLDDARTEQELQEREATREQGIRRLANIVDQSVQDEGLCIANPLRPRPRQHVVSKAANPSVASKGPKDGANLDGSIQGVKEMGPVNEEDAEVAIGFGDEEILTHTVSKKRRSQKTSSHDAVQAARGLDEHGGDNHGSIDGQKWKHLQQWVISQPTNMILLTETVLYYWDCLDELYRQSSLESTKDGVAGIGPVKDWADKLASSKPLHPLLSQGSSPKFPQVRTISGGTGTSTQIKGPRVTPVSSTCPPTPVSALTSESQHSNLYIDGSHDQVEHCHRFTTVHKFLT